MKKILIVLIIMFGIQSSYSQTCDDVLETDYSVLMSRGMSTTLNEWDWTVSDFTDVYYTSVSGNPVGPYSIRSPFFHQGDNANIDFLADSPVKDFAPEDGWELLYKAFGVNELNKGVSTPSFALYNRYTGLLRSFFYVKGLEGYSSAHVKLAYEGEFTENEVSLLENVNTPVHALDDFQRELSANTSNSYTNSAYASGDWLYSEVLTSYDPCACNYSSDMHFLPVLNNVRK